MAKAKSNKGSKAQSFKGIPKQHHKAVRAYIGVMYGGYGENMSPQQAYRRLQEQWKAEAGKKVKQEQERKAENEASRTKYAKDRAKEAVRKLAYLRDFLRPLGEDDFSGDHIEAAVLSHALLVEAGSEVEQALFDLGIVEGVSSGIKGRREGWIKEFLR
jgi:hypothetical protein